MSGEKWLPIAGYEGLYEISDLGRVRSLPRTVPYGGSRAGVSRRHPGGILTTFGKLYPVVKLAKDGRKVCFNVHQLVLEAFVGPRPGGMVCCHGPGGDRDNRLSNLRWDTVTENNRDVVRHGNHFNKNKTHCPSGHEYTPENTYSPPSRPGQRYCRACQRTKNRKRPDRIDAIARVA